MRPLRVKRMLIEFRIDWGGQLLYSRRHYHPVRIWDGRIECRGGAIRAVSSLTYPTLWWGPCQSATATPLPGCAWESRTRRGVAGIEVRAEGSRATEFKLITAQGDFRFTAARLLAGKRLVFHAGPKFGHDDIIVTRAGALWFRPPPEAGEQVLEAGRLRGGQLVHWARMLQRRLAPGECAEWDIRLPPERGGGEQVWRLHIQAMTAGVGLEKPEAQASGYIPMALVEGRRAIDEFRYFLREHDPGVQILHDIRREIPVANLAPGRHRLGIVNRHTALPLLLHRITLRPLIRKHLDMVAPAWTQTGETAHLRVRTLADRTPLRIETDFSVLRPLDAVEGMFRRGEHTFRFLPLRAAADVRIRARDLQTGQRNEARIDAVYAMPSENPEVKIGFDMTTVPHDDCGEMDRILAYTHRTRLGNLVVFRPFTPTPIADNLLKRWGAFCRDHAVYVQAVSGYESGVLPETAGDYFHGMGGHELSYALYGPDPDNRSGNMRDAAKRYMQFIRKAVKRARRPGLKICFGDASGGHRYSLLAGADFLRAETMVQHTQQHLSQARPAAQALGSGEWGAHIAIQHCKQPYLKNHLNQYGLSLAQAWMMGASFLYEEDSLFLMFKEERQTWDDALTRGKREITRDFFRFARTHPRGGDPDVRIAALLGRHAAPFNGFICGPEQGPDYSVWGKFGRAEPSWGHLQPEKAAQLLDVLMPGASTHPLRQRYDRRRFFFSGTPFGDFDQPPIEAGAEFMRRYALCMLPGWNTMIPGDYRRLRQYARSGGVLWLGAPQLSTHEGRGFLESMEDLNLYRGGDARDLCGVRIRGAGTRYSGHWNAVGPEFAEAVCPPSSRAPSRFPGEDGPCRLADVELHGAKPVIVDAVSGKPMLTVFQLGSGRVYLATVWAYPGHEELSDFSGAVMSDLARRHQGEPRVADPSREVFWNRRRFAGFDTIMLLNTDWTRPGNRKSVRIHAAAGIFPISVREGAVVITTVLPFGVLVPEDSEPHIEALATDARSARLRIHARGARRFRLHLRAAAAEIRDGSRIIKLPRGGGCFEFCPGKSTSGEIRIRIP